MNFYEYGMVKVAHNSRMAELSDKILMNRMKADEALPVESRRDPRKQDAYYSMRGGPVAFPKGKGFDKHFGNEGGRANALLGGLSKGTASAKASYPDFKPLPQPIPRKGFLMGTPAPEAGDADQFNSLDGSRIQGGSQQAAAPTTIPQPYRGDERVRANSFPVKGNQGNKPVARRAPSNSGDESFSSVWRSMSAKQRRDEIARIKAEQARAFGSMGPSRPARGGF